MSDPFYIPESAMVIMAHADDAEFACAGTVARWTRAGARVAYTICTDGGAGINDAGITRAEACKIRQREQCAAAEILGVEEVVFLDEPDGLLVNTLALRKKIVREIRRFRPEVAIVLDPTPIFVGENYLNHPDHRAAGTAALDAIYPAAGKAILYPEFEEEGIFPHKVRKVYVAGWDQKDLFVDISETIDLKIKAIQAHESQTKKWDWDVEERFRDRAAELGQVKEMAYAEAFRVVTLMDEETWEATKGRVTPT